MIRLIFIFIIIPVICIAQKTYIPDDNFENFLEANGMGDGLLSNDSVITSNINLVTNLNVNGQNIADLTGIEEFASLTNLYCRNNQLTYLDISSNINLGHLECYNNQISSLDVSQNSVLYHLNCGQNLFTSIDVSNNTALSVLNCALNQITNLDVSNNTALTILRCQQNQLVFLDVRNGNNTNLTTFWSHDNFNLYCINVDDSTWSTNNWTTLIDPQHYFSANCSFNSAQKTYVPDDNFESFLEANGMGDGLLSNDSVITSNVNLVTTLNVNGQNIADLTGIEEFASLTNLYCRDNQLTYLDISSNINLGHLECYNNQISSLDVSNNPALTDILVNDNQLTSLDLRNGNNQAIINIDFRGNPFLSCISVDDPQASDDDWPWDDPWSVYATSCDPINSWNCVGNDCLGDSTGQGMYTILVDCQNICGMSSVIDKENSLEKDLIKVIDILGRDIEKTNKTILFYLFSDGTVEKRIVFEE